MQAMEDELFQRRHLAVVGQSLGLVEAGQRTQQIADRVAQLAIGVDRGLQDLLADALVVRIVDQCDPQAQDVGARFLDDAGRVHGVALGLGHLLPVLVQGEAVGQHRLERRPAARARTFQQGGLEPAAVLVGAFQVEVGGPVRRPVAAVAVLRRARIQGEGVGRAAVEPDVQDVRDLFIGRGVEVTEEVAVGRGEPDVGAVFGHGLGDAGVHVCIDQRLARRLVDEHGQRRAPRALAADQPVGSALDHRADAVLARRRMEIGGVDRSERRAAQGLAAFDRLIHADEPLRRVPEDHRRLGAPAVRVGVLQTAAREQVSGLDQLVHHRAVGRAELAGLLALCLQHLETREQGHVRIVGAVRIHRVRHLGEAVGEPDLIVIRPVAGGGVHKAGARIVGDVLARQQRHLIAEALVLRPQRMATDHAGAVHVGDAAPFGDHGRLLHVLRQLVGQDQPIAGLGPRLEGEVRLHRLDFIQAIGDVRAVGDGAVGRDGPGRGGPDHHRGVVRRQAEDVLAPLVVGDAVAVLVIGLDRELDPDRGRRVVVILDLGVGQGRALDRRPHDGLGAAIQLAGVLEPVELGDDGGLGREVHGGVSSRPVGGDAQALELLALDVDPAGGVVAAGLAEFFLGDLVLAAAL